MKKPLVIALCGRRKCGKDTVADIIQKKDPDFEKISFADAVKGMFSSNLNVDIDHLYDVQKKEEYREAIQGFAESYKENLGNDVFAKTVTSIIDEKGWEKVIIPDLRFIEEIATLMKYDLRIYRVHADRHARIARGWVQGVVDEHISETELGDISSDTLRAYNGAIIYNNYLNIQDLQLAISDLVFHLKQV